MLWVDQNVDKKLILVGGDGDLVGSQHVPVLPEASPIPVGLAREYFSHALSEWAVQMMPL